MSLQEQALRDALHTARVRLADERHAVAVCTRMGYDTDARFAAREVVHYEQLVARIEAQMQEAR